MVQSARNVKFYDRAMEIDRNPRQIDFSRPLSETRSAHARFRCTPSAEVRQAAHRSRVELCERTHHKKSVASTLILFVGDLAVDNT